MRRVAALLTRAASPLAALPREWLVQLNSPGWELRLGRGWPGDFFDSRLAPALPDLLACRLSWGRRGVPCSAVRGRGTCFDIGSCSSGADAAAVSTDFATLDAFLPLGGGAGSFCALTAGATIMTPSPHTRVNSLRECPSRLSRHALPNAARNSWKIQFIDLALTIGEKI